MTNNPAPPNPPAIARAPASPRQRMKADAEMAVERRDPETIQTARHVAGGKTEKK